MTSEPICERAARHVAAFNDSVRSGEWADFAARFTPDATMHFAWDTSSTTGTMTLRWSGDLIAELTVTFS